MILCLFNSGETVMEESLTIDIVRTFYPFYYAVICLQYKVVSIINSKSQHDTDNAETILLRQTSLSLFPAKNISM